MRFTALPVHGFEDVTLDLQQLQSLLTVLGVAGGVLAGTYPNPTMAPLVWTGLPYATGWTDFAANYRPGQYATDGATVWLRGDIKNTVAYSFSGSNNTLFTMPVGLRPPTNQAQIYKMMCRDGLNNYSVVAGQILETGVFLIFAAVGTNGGSAQNTAVPFISLDGIYWNLT